MQIQSEKKAAMDPGLAEEIQRLTGQNVYRCYQCRKCAAGCPNRPFMNRSVTELMRYIQLGMSEKAMKTNTIWYCLSCHTCSARCPQDIDIPRVIDALRITVQSRKIKADTLGWRLFNALWMNMLRYTGRMYEAGLVGTLNTLRARPFKDMALGVAMFRKGKLKLRPPVTKPLEMMRMFKRARKIEK